MMARAKFHSVELRAPYPCIHTFYVRAPICARIMAVTPRTGQMA